MGEEGSGLTEYMDRALCQAMIGCLFSYLRSSDFKQ